MDNSDIDTSGTADTGAPDAGAPATSSHPEIVATEEINFDTFELLDFDAL